MLVRTDPADYLLATVNFYLRRRPLAHRFRRVYNFIAAVNAENAKGARGGECKYEGDA